MPLILDGLLGETFPSWTTATRPVAPAPGQVGFNSTLNSLETYNGTSWVVGGLPAPSTNGNVLTSNGTDWVSSTGPVGVSQTWQLPTRVSGTSYTNSTGKPIQVLVTFNQNTSASGTGVVVVGGVTISSTNYSLSASGGSIFYTVSFIVPNSTAYTVTATSGVSIGTWAELR